MRNKIRFTTYLDKKTEEYLKGIVEEEAQKTGKEKNKSKAVRNAIRVYYNYLQYQKGSGEI